jgi:carboxyl-terminal processing protease
MIKTQRVMTAAGVAAMLTLTACGNLPISGATVRDMLNNRQPTAAADTLAPRIQAQLRDFDFAVNSLKAMYITSEATGSEWQKVVDEERNKIISAKDETGEQFGASLRAIVEKIGDEDLTLQAAPAPQAAGTPRFSGIGVQVDLPREGKDRLLILTVYPDSPADRAGIQPHDAIVAIEGEPVNSSTPPDQIIGRLRGEEGSDVTVSVRTPGQAPRDVTITRRMIEPNSPIVYKRLPDTNIGYIAPDPTDLDSLRQDVTRALRELNAEQNIDGLVLDLRVIRDNRFPLNDALSLFVNGPVGHVQVRNQREAIDVAGKSIGGSQEVPMVVLVSEQTTGQAEAFAGLLQDAGRAQIIGNPTPGLLAQISPMTLPTSQIQMLIPTGDYVGLKNTSWRGKGVQPNITSEKTWEEFTADNDPQLQQAIDALTGK